MQQRQNISSGAKWENLVGYSRAVRIGNTIEISGTTSIDEKGITVGIGAPFLQTRFILQKIAGVLEQCGASMKDVIRTRIYTVDISKWEEIGKAHKEFFSDIKPATSMVEVCKLISPELLVEIEVTAIV